MKKGYIAVFIWLFLTVWVGASLRYVNIKEFEFQKVMNLLLCNLAAILVCLWGAYRKYSYFYKPLTVSVNNRFFKFAYNYNLSILRIIMSFITLHCFIIYFVESHFLTFIIFLCLTCIYFALGYWYKKKLYAELKKVADVLPEIPTYNILSDLFPIWSIALIVILLIIANIIW